MSTAVALTLCRRSFRWLYPVRAVSTYRKCSAQTFILRSEVHHDVLRTHLRWFSLARKKQFWNLDTAFNKVDEERVRLAGADRACAEWVLKNGGTIKWTTSSDPLHDYNLLPSTDFQSYKLEMVDLSGTDVVAMGFAHFEHLKHVKSVRLHGCRCISDESLVHIATHIKDTLENLEISWCPMVTAKGLQHLTELKKLKYLLVHGLIEVPDLESAIQSLRQDMPWCHICTNEPMD